VTAVAGVPATRPELLSGRRRGRVSENALCPVVRRGTHRLRLPARAAFSERRPPGHGVAALARDRRISWKIQAFRERGREPREFFHVWHRYCYWVGGEPATKLAGRVEGRGYPSGTSGAVLLTRSPGALAEGRGCQSPGGCFLRHSFYS